MAILNGWKEIGECLNRTSRSAQRWERLGLPVRRVSNSSRSPIIAFSDEIERWARERAPQSSAGPVPSEVAAFTATLRETMRLVTELRNARIKHNEAVESIRVEVFRKNH